MNCAFIGFCALTPEAQAAWFQGVASVIGLAIAIGVPYAQSRSAGAVRATERLALARSLGLALLGDLRLVGHRLNNLWGVHDEVIRSPSPEVHAALELPQNLAANAARLHELGAAAEPTQRLLFLLERSREIFEPFADSTPNDYEAKQLSEFLWEATGAVTDAMNAIEGMFRSRLSSPADP